MSRELLLEWTSEVGQGDWPRFKKAHEWLLPPGTRPPWETPSFTASVLSMLGHVEFDWHEGHWATCPPVLTLLPAAGAHALLTGGRTRTLIRRLEGHLADHERLFPLDPIAQEHAPCARLIPCDDAADVIALAQALGIEFSHSVSDELSRHLPDLNDYLEPARTGPPARGFGFKRLDLESLRWVELDYDDEPGLYLYDTPRRPLYRLSYGHGFHYAVDLAVGVWGAFAAWEIPRLRWQRQSVNGELVAPLRAPLPTLHARTATLASGLAPFRRGRSVIFDNVPHATAQAIGRSLGQRLEVG